MTIKYDITNEIDGSIDSMSTGGGYNFDYDNINEHKPGSKTYPNVKTEYPDDEYLDPDEQMVDSYSSNLTAIFTVTVSDSVNSPRLDLSKVLEDFQRLLEAKHAILQGKGSIVGDLTSDETTFSNIRKRPGTIKMEWNIFYRVKRSNPSATI